MSCSTGSITPRASSGSRSRINSVEPLISANSAVTVLRSPLAAPLAAGGKDDDKANDVAHCEQNLASGALSKLHFGQRWLSDAPHWLQKRAPTALSVPHFEQCIEQPLQ